MTASTRCSPCPGSDTSVSVPYWNRLTLPVGALNQLPSAALSLMHAHPPPRATSAYSVHSLATWVRAAAAVLLCMMMSHAARHRANAHMRHAAAYVRACICRVHGAPKCYQVPLLPGGQPAPVRKSCPGVTGWPAASIMACRSAGPAARAYRSREVTSSKSMDADSAGAMGPPGRVDAGQQRRDHSRLRCVCMGRGRGACKRLRARDVVGCTGLMGAVAVHMPMPPTTTMVAVAWPPRHPVHLTSGWAWLPTH